MPGLFPTRARYKKSPFLGLSGLKHLKKGDFLCRASSPQEPGTKSHLFWAFPAPSTSKKVTFCAGPLPRGPPATSAPHPEKRRAGFRVLGSGFWVLGFGSCEVVQGRSLGLGSRVYSLASLILNPEP